LSAQTKENGAALLFCERSDGVLVVFELDHRVILLKPFKMIHKGIFAKSPVFVPGNAIPLMSS
jgi:hypothetical protein